MPQPPNAQLIAADERLTEVIRHVYAVQQPTQAPALPQQLVPNYEMLLVFNFGPEVPVWLGETAYPVGKTAAIGPLQTLLRYELPPGADLLVVVFTLNGFHRLLGKPMQQLRGLDVFDPDLLLDQPCFQQLWYQLATMPTVPDRIACLNAYALAYLSPVDDDTRSVIDGVAHFNNPTVDPVKALAQTRYLTPRSIQTRVQTNLGFPAKELLRFVRFKRVVSQLVAQYPAVPDWPELVLAHGYHDQSHLIKDFQRFLGMTPTEFVRQLAGGEVCITQPGRYY